MAKAFLVIVCYCTICMHIAPTVYATKAINHQQHRMVLDSDVQQLNGHKRYEMELKSDQNSIKYRSKRHASIQQTDNSNKLEMNSNTHEFIQKIFKQFGNSDDGTMNVVGFEKMLHQLGLDRMIDDYEKLTNKDSGPLSEDVSNRNESVSLFINKKFYNFFFFNL